MTMSPKLFWGEVNNDLKRRMETPYPKDPLPSEKSDPNTSPPANSDDNQAVLFFLQKQVELQAQQLKLMNKIRKELVLNRKVLLLVGLADVHPRLANHDVLSAIRRLADMADKDADEMYTRSSIKERYDDDSPLYDDDE